MVHFLDSKRYGFRSCEFPGLTLFLVSSSQLQTGKETPTRTLLTTKFGRFFDVKETRAWYNSKWETLYSTTEVFKCLGCCFFSDGIIWVDDAHIPKLN